MIRATWESKNSFEQHCFTLVVAHWMVNKNISPNFLSIYSFGKYGGVGKQQARMFNCKHDKRIYVFNLLPGVKL